MAFELVLKLKFELKPRLVLVRFALRFMGFVLMFVFVGTSFWKSQNKPAPKLRTTNVPSIVNTTVLTVFCGGGGG